MIRGKQGSRSLNDIGELDPTEDSNIPFRANRIRTSWSFSNLLPNADGEELESDKIESESQAKEAEHADHMSRLKGKSSLEKFQVKLAHQVATILKGAATNESLLEELFYNISSDVPVEVSSKLNLEIDRRWYYYELLATYYYSTEKKELGYVMNNIISPLCSKLWSLEHFPSIFALIFHRWLVETDAGTEGSGWIMRFNIFLKGAYQLFWFDIHHDTHRLWPIYVRLRDKMFATSSPFFAVSPNRGFDKPSSPSSDAKRRIRDDFACVLCRFYYYYSTRPERVGNFCINQLQLENGLDTYVLELVKQLRGIKNEKVLARYLKCTSTLPLESLKLSSRNKLYATLNELLLPGAPLYPTEKVSIQAELTMNLLYPQGKWSRSLINMFFKVLRPFYIPQLVFGYLNSFFGNSNDVLDDKKNK